MKTGLVIALPLVLLAGCAPQSYEAVAEKRPAGEVAREAALLPTCDDVRGGDERVDQLTSCRLVPGGGKAELVVSSSAIRDHEGTVRVALIGADGAELQVIEETVMGAFGYPHLDDLSGDGRADLMVPVISGMVNTGYALWLQNDKGLFSRAGEIGGFDISLGSGGVIAATGRSSAWEWETVYFSIDDGSLKEIAAVVQRADPEEGEPPSELASCEVLRAAEGVDIARFCGSEGAP